MAAHYNRLLAADNTPTLAIVVGGRRDDVIAGRIRRSVDTAQLLVVCVCASGGISGWGFGGSIVV